MTKAKMIKNLNETSIAIAQLSPHIHRRLLHVHQHGGTDSALATQQRSNVTPGRWLFGVDSAGKKVFRHNQTQETVLMGSMVLLFVNRWIHV